MTREHEGHYRDKYPPGTKPDQKIAEAVRGRAHEKSLTCAQTFEIARELSAQPIEVGRTADLLEIHISQCQLGLFGYEPQKRIVKPLPSVEVNLEKTIQARLVNGRLPCATAFNIAEQFRIPRMTVSSACETLGVKISSCQLGTF